MNDSRNKQIKKLKKNPASETDNNLSKATSIAKVRENIDLDNTDDEKQVDVNFITFWRPSDQNSYLGQWYSSKFTLTKDIIDGLPEQITKLELFSDKYDVIEKLSDDKHVYNCAEQFMMMGKAALFYDNIIFNKMKNCNTAKDHKTLGRLIQKFDIDIWNKYCKDIVTIGSYLKFSQNEILKNKLLATGNAKLVEGSPLDKIWGVGLKFDDPAIYDIKNWQGTNFLGNCLEYVRNII
jgi:ribA/ribD-fused uncharacterized protein